MVISVNVYKKISCVKSLLTFSTEADHDLFLTCSLSKWERKKRDLVVKLNSSLLLHISCIWTHRAGDRAEHKHTLPHARSPTHTLSLVLIRRGSRPPPSRTTGVTSSLPVLLFSSTPLCFTLSAPPSPLSLFFSLYSFDPPVFFCFYSPLHWLSVCSLPPLFHHSSVFSPASITPALTLSSSSPSSPHPFLPSSNLSCLFHLYTFLILASLFCLLCLISTVRLIQVYSSRQIITKIK